MNTWLTVLKQVSNMILSKHEKFDDLFKACSFDIYFNKIIANAQERTSNMGLDNSSAKQLLENVGHPFSLLGIL